jgi:zinc protease
VTRAPNGRPAARPARPARFARLAPLAAAALAAGAGAAPAQFPSAPPGPGPAGAAALPPFQEATLPNGVRVVLVESHRVPLVAFRLAVAAGGVYAPAGKEGLAQLAAQLLTRGAGARSADDLAAALEGAGATLVVSAGDDVLSLAGSVLSTNTALALRLLGEVVARPTFPEREVERVRQQALSALQLERSQPAAVAARVLAAGLHGAHPYGRAPRPASVRAVARADLVAFQQSRLRPQGALLVVAGDVTMADLRRMAEQGFAGWTGAPAPAPVPAAPAPRPRAELVLVDRPGAAQASIAVGNLTPGPADPAWYAAGVANRVLGGGPGARLFEVLRERRGWAYNASATLSARRGGGVFTAAAEVRAEAADSALVELLAQLRRLGAEPVAAAELGAARGSLAGAFPLSVETSQQVAEQVAQALTLGLPADFLRTYRARVNAVEPDDVQRAARAYVRPEQALVVVAGDAARLRERLGRVGLPLRVADPEGNVVTSAAPAAAAPVGLDLARLAARRDSFAVRSRGNTVGSNVATVRRSADGWELADTSTLLGVVRIATRLSTDGRLAPRRFERAGTVQGRPVAADIVFSDGRATGTATNPTPNGSRTERVDVAVPAGALAASALAAALPLLRWAPGARHAVTVFDEGRATVRTLTLAVAGREQVAVPAGAFEAFRVDQAGGDQPVTYYVTTGPGHRLVRYTVGPQFEAVLVR